MFLLSKAEKQNSEIFCNVCNNVVVLSHLIDIITGWDLEGCAAEFSQFNQTHSGLDLERKRPCRNAEDNFEGNGYQIALLKTLKVPCY